MSSIIIFASGNGTNAQAIIDYFHTNGKAKISLIVSNNPKAGVINIAKQESIPFLLVDKTTFQQQLFIEQLKDFKPSIIVLAGFLWKIPVTLINTFPSKIINLHPALLPLFGGKGMYGMNVHQEVIASGAKESGITIHQVNENYDDGAVLLQVKCAIEPTDTPQLLAQKIHELEHFYLPRSIHYLLEHVQ